MNLDPFDFERAKDGSLFVKKGDKLVAITRDELLEPIKRELKKIDSNEQNIADLKKYTAHFQKFAKSHFIVVFSHFVHKVMLGKIQIDDISLLELDEKVLKGELSIEEALDKHEYLKSTFNAIFESSDDKIEFPLL